MGGSFCKDGEAGGEVSSSDQESGRSEDFEDFGLELLDGVAGGVWRFARLSLESDFWSSVNWELDGCSVEETKWI